MALPFSQGGWCPQSRGSQRTNTSWARYWSLPSSWRQFCCCADGKLSSQNAGVGRPPSPTEPAPDECVGATDRTRKEVQILGVASASPGTNRTPEFLDKSGKSAKV